MFPKINCVFHPHQILTNFCLQKNCLLPLCPTCIKIHTIEHISLKTNPKYQQINQLMSEVSEELKECSTLLGANLKTLIDIEDKRRSHKEVLLEKLQNVKREIILIVQSHFNELQIQLDRAVKQIDLSEQIEKFRKMINKHIESFKLLEETLYSPKAMRTIIKFKGEEIKQKAHFSNKITRQFLFKCENTLLRLDLQCDYKTIFKNCLNELTSLKSNGSYSSKIEPLDISETLADIREDGNNNANNKVEKRYPKNKHIESISIDHNRSKRSNSEEGKSTKVRPGLQLVHLQQFQSNAKNNQKKVSFNRPYNIKQSRQNINPKFIY